MHQVAAAAEPKMRTDRLNAMGRRGQNALQSAIDGGFAYLDNLDFTAFPGDRPFYKYGAVLKPCHPQSLTGDAGDFAGENLIFVHGAFLLMV